MTRTKEISTTLTSMDEADDTLKQISQLNHRKVETENWVTAQEQKIRDEAKGKLIIDKKSGETVDDRIAALEANLLAFIEKNRIMFDGKKRSMELVHGTIGYRLGTPKVDVIGRITMKAIMTTEALMRKLRSWGWIIEKPNLDRQGIIDAYNTDKSKTLAKLSQVSMKVTQEDEPWFEPRQAELNMSQEQAA